MGRRIRVETVAAAGIGKREFSVFLDGMMSTMAWLVLGDTPYLKIQNTACVDVVLISLACPLWVQPTLPVS